MDSDRSDLALVYDELRRMAGAYLARERSGHTLQPTALVHEAYLKLAGQDGRWTDPSHFAALCAGAMRRILVDHARGRRAQKRGGSGERVTLSGLGGVEEASEDSLDLLAVDEALRELSTLNRRQADLIELRFFGGLTLEDAARHLGIARSTAIADWRLARAWLNAKLG